MVKEYVKSCPGCVAGDTHVESCLCCEARDTRNLPAPLVLRSRPRKLWQEVTVVSKGPTGGSNARQEGFKTEKTTPHQPQVNGSVGKVNRSIGKMTRGAIAGKKDPEACPSQLLRQGTIRTEVLVCISCPTGKAHKEARQPDRKQKKQNKNYADKVKEEKDIRDDSAKEEKDMPDDSDKEEKEGQ